MKLLILLVLLLSELGNVGDGRDDSIFMGLFDAGFTGRRKKHESWWKAFFTWGHSSVKGTSETELTAADIVAAVATAEGTKF